LGRGGERGGVGWNLLLRNHEVVAPLRRDRAPAISLSPSAQRSIASHPQRHFLPLLFLRQLFLCSSRNTNASLSSFYLFSILYWPTLASAHFPTTPKSAPSQNCIATPPYSIADSLLPKPARSKIHRPTLRSGSGDADADACSVDISAVRDREYVPSQA